MSPRNLYKKTKMMRLGLPGGTKFHDMFNCFDTYHVVTNGRKEARTDYKNRLLSHIGCFAIACIGSTSALAFDGNI